MRVRHSPGLMVFMEGSFRIVDVDVSVRDLLGVERYGDLIYGCYIFDGF